MTRKKINRPIAAQGAASATTASETLAPYLLIITLAIAVYWNTAAHGFVYDDVEGILNSPLIARFSRLSEAWQLLSEPWRPVTQLSYALTICFAGANARPFHVTNILIHAINSLLVFGIARRVAKRWISEEKSKAFALAAALIHAVHPLYTQAVSYIWGRSSSLCALFYFSSLLLTMMGYEKHGPRRYLCCSCAALCGILAWKTKEEAMKTEERLRWLRSKGAIR